MRGITATYGNLITFLNANSLKEDMEFFYLSRHVLELVRSPPIVRQGIQRPVLFNTLFNEFYDIFHCADIWGFRGSKIPYPQQVCRISRTHYSY